MDPPAKQSPVSAPKRLLLAALNCACGSVMLASLIGFAGGLDWRLDLFSHFRLHALLALLPLGALALKLRAWRPAALAGGGVAACMLALAPVLLASTPEVTAGGPTLRVMAHNVYTPNQRYGDVSAQVRDVDPDLLLLQEIDSGWVSALEGSLGPLRPLKGMARPDNFGIGVWVREGLEAEAHVLELGEAGVPSLKLSLILGDRLLEVYGVHTLPPRTTNYAEWHAAQLIELAELGSNAEACVILGDLNATPWSSSYGPLAERGFAGGVGLGGSWPAPLPAWARIPIDHCLVRGSIGIQELRYGEPCGSDHSPVIATLALSPQ